MKPKLVAWMFVIVQAILLILLVFLPSKATLVYPLAQLAGKSLLALGLLILLVAIYDLRHSLTVLPTPIKHGKLKTNGMYRYMRHPMYTGVIAISIGIAISSGWYIKYLLAIGLVVLFALKARYEEKLLAAQYAGYSKYMQTTPQFLPCKL